MSKDNPFSFSKFTKADDSLPFPTEEKKKKKKKKPKQDASPNPVTAPPPKGTDQGPIVGQRVQKGEQQNPFGFNAFVANKPGVSPSAPAPQGAASDESPTVIQQNSQENVQRPSSTHAPPPLPSENTSDASSMSDSASSGSDLDSDSDDGDGGGLPPLPTPAAQDTGSSSKGDGGGSILSRLKRRMTLLNQQLVAAKGELAMAKEQNELDTFELREENASLKKQLRKAKSALQMAEKAAAQSEAALARRRDSERKEAEVLEDFTARIQHNLEQSTARAMAAEQKVASLQAEVNRLQGNNLSGGALGQVRQASKHLDELSKDSEAALRKLCEGVKTFKLISDILQSCDRIEEQ